MPGCSVVLAALLSHCVTPVSQTRHCCMLGHIPIIAATGHLRLARLHTGLTSHQLADGPSSKAGDELEQCLLYVSGTALMALPGPTFGTSVLRSILPDEELCAEPAQHLCN